MAKNYAGNYVTIWESFQITLLGKGHWKFFVEEYWPGLGGIFKCLGANARGFPGVNLPGWPLISAL